jgi:hypothetical protein
MFGIRQAYVGWVGGIVFHWDYMPQAGSTAFRWRAISEYLVQLGSREDGYKDRKKRKMGLKRQKEQKKTKNKNQV